MILFVLGALISFGAFSSSNLKRFLPFWLPGAVLLAASIGREPSVMFLTLFLAPTAAMGTAVLLRRMSPMPFLLFALSDVILATAVSIYQSKSSLWTLPPVGAWGPGAEFAAVAAIVRLGGAADVGDEDEGGLLSLGWWQGAMLAYWVGGSSAGVLALGGLVLWAAAAYFSHSNLAGLTLAGGVLALGAGLGAPLASLLVIGLAGTALALGERVVASWIVAILPMSLLTSVRLPERPYLILAALLFPVAWVGMSARLGRIRPAAGRTSLLVPTAGLLAAGYVASLLASLVTMSAAPGRAGTPLQVINSVWLLYGVALAALVTFSVVGPSLPAAQEPSGSGQFSDFHVLVPRLTPPVAWLSFGVAAVLAVRLMVAGLRTGFL